MANYTYMPYNGYNGGYTAQSPYVGQFAAPNGYAPQNANLPPQNAQMQGQPQMPMQNGQQFAAPQTQTNKIYVTGIDEVKAKQTPFNSDFLFLDNDKPFLYQKITDSTGRFEVKRFRVVEDNEAKTEATAAAAVAAPDMSKYVSIDDYDKVKSELDEIRTANAAYNAEIDDIRAEMRSLRKQMQETAFAARNANKRPKMGDGEKREEN